MPTQPNEQTPILPHNYYPEEYAMLDRAHFHVSLIAKTLLCLKIMQIGFHLDMVRCNKEPDQPLHIFKIPYYPIFDSGTFEFGLGDIVFGGSLSVTVIDHTRVCHQFGHATLVLITTGCSNTQRDEAIIDTILLTIRNTVQLCRFAAMIQRNKRTLDSRAAKVDFTGLNHQPSQSSLAPSQFAADSEDDDGVLV